MHPAQGFDVCAGLIQHGLNDRGFEGVLAHPSPYFWLEEGARSIETPPSVASTASPPCQLTVNINDSISRVRHTYGSLLHHKDIFNLSSHV